MLLEVLGLSHSNSRSSTLNDVIIIAIDFEYIQTIKSGFAQKTDSQVGFAILDTKDLRQIQSEVPEQTQLISTFNFVTGSSSYVTKVSNKFLFGKTITIPSSSMAHIIQSRIPKDRNVMLVGHGVSSELHILQFLGFKFSRPPGILDTSRVADEVFQIWNGSLRDLLILLECPFKKLHIAGNDANFTLRALLLLAVKWCMNQQRQKNDKILNILRHISTSTRSIPSYIDPEIKAAEKREKRLMKSRKYQSKSWSQEQQDQIRDARARKRLEHTATEF